MLTLRREQLDQLGRFSYDSFVTRMRVHLRNFYPEQCDALGDRKLGELIEFGIERAGRHGFESERDVCKYIDLMCVFGHAFDRNERLPWARHILESRYPSDPGERMRQLHSTAIDALRELDRMERREGGR